MRRRLVQAARARAARQRKREAWKRGRRRAAARALRRAVLCLLADPQVTKSQREALREVLRQVRAGRVATFDLAEWRTLAGLELDRDPPGRRGLLAMVVRQERRDCWLVAAPR